MYYLKVSQNNCYLENFYFTSKPVLKYQGFVITSDKPLAGTNETVNLWLTGSTGKCKGPLAIRDAKKSLLERNQKNEIIIDLSENIGDLQKVSFY